MEREFNPDRHQWKDPFWAALFVAVGGAAFVIQCIFISKAQAFYSWVDCMAGEQSPDLLDAVNKLLNEGVGGIMKQVGFKTLSISVVFTWVLCAAWMYALRSCAWHVVWGSYALSFAASFAGVFYLRSVGGYAFTDSLFIVPMLCWAVCLLCVILKREAVDKAARMISAATTAMQENCMLYVVTFVLQLLQLFYIVFFIFSNVSSYFAYGIEAVPADSTWQGSATCGYIDSVLFVKSAATLQPPTDWTIKGYYFSNIAFMWMLLCGDMIRLYVVSGTIGSWYFTPPEHPPPKNSTIQWTKFALTYSLGSCALASLFLTLLRRLKQWASGKCTICCPHVIIAKILLCLFENLLKMMTRFALIASSLTGQALWPSGRMSSGVIMRQFGDAVTNESTAEVVLNFNVLMLTTLVGFASWMLTAAFLHANDDQLPYDPFKFEFQVCADSGFCQYLTYILRGALFGFSGFVAYNTMLGLFFLILFPVIWTSVLNVPFYVGMMSLIVAKLIFSYLGAVVADATSAMFMCHALDKELGTHSAKAHMIDGVVDMVNKNMHEGLVGAGEGVIVAGQGGTTSTTTIIMNNNSASYQPPAPVAVGIVVDQGTSLLPPGYNPNAYNSNANAYNPNANYPPPESIPMG